MLPARLLLPLSLSLLLSLSGTAAASAASVTAAPSRPNLLIIQTDEHNFRTLGCYRALLPADQAFIWGEGIKVDTPNLDWIAAHGAIADRFYATSPVCTPSRAALLTGRYPQNTGAIQNFLVEFVERRLDGADTMFSRTQACNEGSRERARTSPRIQQAHRSRERSEHRSPEFSHRRRGEELPEFLLTTSGVFYSRDFHGVMLPS